MTFRRRTVGAIAAALALAVGLVGCSQSGSDTGGGSAPTELRIGTFSEPTSFDPAQAGEGLPIPFYQAVYDSLLIREPDGTLSPNLATKWAYNDDNSVLTLTLTDAAKFTDGTPVDASAVKANIERFKTANGPQAIAFADVTSVDAPDPTTVVINLSAPNPALLYQLATAPGFIANPAYFDNPDLTSTPAGSGPYTLDASATTVGSQYTFVRNPDYWGRKLPYNKITFVILSDETSRVNALKSGQIDTTLLLEPGNANDLVAAGFKLEPGAVNWEGISYYDRNGTSVPALADVRVRQALNYAIDSKSMLDGFLLGKGTLTSQIFGPNTLAFDSSLDGTYAYDPDKARSLLAEAGYPNGFSVEIPQSPSFDPAVITSLVQQWKEIGVTVTVKQLGPGELIPLLTGGKAAMTYMQFSQPTDWEAITQFIAPDAIWNPFHTEDPKVDSLISEFQHATDDAGAKAAAQELNKYIVDQAWFGPFYRPQLLTVHSADVVVQNQAGQAVPSIYNYAPKG